MMVFYSTMYLHEYAKDNNAFFFTKWGDYN